MLRDGRDYAQLADPNNKRLLKLNSVKRRLTVPIGFNAFVGGEFNR